jgi:hypothetical protein
VTQVPWSSETRYRLPVSVWREAIDAHFPNSAWIRLSTRTFDDLLRFKSARGLVSWEATILQLLAETAGTAPGDQAAADRTGEQA